MISYIVAILVVFALLIFLKFCEGTPVRSWLAVFLVGIPLGLSIGYYCNHFLPKKPEPLPQSVKAAAYGKELERAIRRVAGVDKASVEGSTIQMNFSQDKPLAELKKIARDLGGNASFFLKTNNNSVKITVHMSVQGRDRYEMDYDSNRGVTDEREL